MDTDIRDAITALYASAPPEAQKALLGLLPAAKASLDQGYAPAFRAVPIKHWYDLFGQLSDIATHRFDSEVLLRVTNDLLSIADEMVPPEEALRESAEILVRALHAELYVCRLRDSLGEWHVTAANRPDGGAIPIFSPVLDENLDTHPVMRAVCEGVRHVVSNDLRAVERGGESVDCMAYMAGCRSRLAFVLRERRDRAPFGLVLLYSEKEHGFDTFDNRFLSKCARIVALTTGRRVAVARDALEKAAGAVAHHGNNAVAILRNHAEFCAELLDDMDDNWEQVVQLSEQLQLLLPPASPGYDIAVRMRDLLHRMDTNLLTEHLDGVLRSSRRITRIIDALEESAERPRLMHYVLGRNVLDLGNTKEEDES